LRLYEDPFFMPKLVVILRKRRNTRRDAMFASNQRQANAQNQIPYNYSIT
jgi:hypothetical protein